MKIRADNTEEFYGSINQFRRNVRPALVALGIPYKDFAERAKVRTASVYKANYLYEGLSLEIIFKILFSLKNAAKDDELVTDFINYIFEKKLTPEQQDKIDAAMYLYGDRRNTDHDQLKMRRIIAEVLK